MRVDEHRIRRLGERMGLGMSQLARKAGLSRQAVYQMLGSDYRAVSPGLEAVAEALEVDPVDLLVRSDPRAGKIDEVLDVVERASHGDARAFEVLPASVLEVGSRHHVRLEALPDPQARLLAAAAEIARSYSSRVWLDRFIRSQEAWSTPGLGFFFGVDTMDLGRIIKLTPGPMREHLVFGAFDMSQFSRHIP